MARCAVVALCAVLALAPDVPAAATNAAPSGAVNSRLTLQLAMLIAVVYAAVVCLWVAVLRPRVRNASALKVGSAVGPSRADTDAVWTCAIGWQAGPVRSRFRALVAPPDGRGRRVIARSRSVHWPPRQGESLPTAELVAALESLVAALVAAGWEPVDSSGSWCARRFVWRHAGKPPGRVR